ncbi:MAG: hypothetical protein JSW58_07295 [Candidatus Latescibacterota bacterium]|nr:MAG: hypothetical protein JSW58_07295 [Candidatus Latescibacterota bacterium]
MNTSRKILSFAALLSVLIFGAFAMISCGDDGKPGKSDDIIGPQPDTIPPAAVTDLRLRAPTHQTLALAWTAPGDDGHTGTAECYDIRWHKSMITKDNWEQATPLDPSAVPTPKPCGEIETTVARGLDSSTRYYFALKTIDDAANESTLSNCASGTTLQESDPPADVTDLVATAIDETSFELTWTAPGDDWMSGTATAYDIRYSAWPIVDETAWAGALPVTETPSPRPAAEQESFIVTGMSSPNNFFALKTVDEQNNWSGLSNLAAGLGIGEDLWAVPSGVTIGETMYIVFRASNSNFTRVSLHEYFWWWEDKTCGDKIVEDIVLETFPGGVHIITYDFYDDEFNRYHPTGYYHLSVCWGPIMRQWTYAVLSE